MSIFFTLVSATILFFSCNQPAPTASKSSMFRQTNINVNNSTPTVDIGNYTLISATPEKDTTEANEIMKVKRLFPLAVQRKDSALFESILADDFTFTGEGEFYNRAEYINDRIHSTESVSTAKFEALILQLFDNYGILSYRNMIEHSDKAGKKDTLRMNWTDLYVKERGKWKIKTVHLIEMKAY
jgi:hypothetical protein